MALSSTRLKNAIKSAVDSIDFTSGEKDNDELVQALADAIVNEITSNAEVVIPSGSSAGTYSIT